MGLCLYEINRGLFMLVHQPQDAIWISPLEDSQPINFDKVHAIYSYKK